MTDYIPPHSREAEQASLGAMMFDNRILLDGIEAHVGDILFNKALKVVLSFIPSIVISVFFILLSINFKAALS